MFWTSPYTRHKTRTNKQNKKYNTICVGHHHTQDTRQGQINKAKSITQYVLDITMHKTQDEDKQNKNHNTICVGHHFTQYPRRRHAKQKHNTICVEHHCTPTNTKK